MKIYSFLWIYLCVPAVLALLITEMASAATAEAMGQGMIIVVLYGLALCLPIPYGFLLAVYSLSLKNQTIEVPRWFYVVSALLLILIALAVIVIINPDLFEFLSTWEILFGVDLVAIALIAILVIRLVRLGKLWVVIAFIPASIVLFLFSIVIAIL